MADIRYRVYRSGIGWEGWVKNGGVAGSTDQDATAIAAIQIQLDNPPANVHVNYRVRMENIGWTGLVADGNTAGREDGSMRSDMLYIELANAAKLHVFYRVFVPNTGWLGWAGDGGNAGKSKRWIKAVQVILHEFA